MSLLSPVKSLEGGIAIYDVTKNSQSPASCRVLSIDGGGIRGTIPGMILEKIEDMTKQPICKLFDQIVGTSTGGVLAGGLTIPKKKGSTEPKFTAADMTKFYSEKAKEVFPPTSIWKKPLSWAENLVYPKYDPSGLVKVVDEYCGDALFRDSLTEVRITSWDDTDQKLFYFQSHMAKKDPDFIDLQMARVMRAATAAPTYFPSEKMTYGGKVHDMIDAGIYLNNPAMSAYTLGKEFFGRPDDQYVLLSLGTGVSPVEGPSNWQGEAAWARKFLDVSFLAAAEVPHRQLESIFSPYLPDKKYFRFQADIDPKYDSLDNTSKEEIAYLKGKAEEIIEEKQDDLNALCSKLEVQQEKSRAARWGRWLGFS